MKEFFRDFNFRQDTIDVIAQAATIVAEYQEQGLELTLRQLYYQFVARALLPNNQRSYDRLGKIISNARLAGLIDWNAIVDRTRNLESNSHWDEPSEIIHSAATSYAIDLWEDQKYRPEVWIEKEALIGVVEGIASEMDVAFFACRGYVSQSEQWRSGHRFRNYIDAGQIPVIIHLGDHDPSGIDMTRDNGERVCLFSESYVQVDRIALNMDQIDEYSPPP